MTLNLSIAETAPDAPPCKGQFFRYIETVFTGKHGRMVFSKELRPLRSLSCPGCAECGPHEDSIKESLSCDPTGAIQFSPKLAHGDTVHLVPEATSVDWETGYADPCVYKVVKVASGEKP